MTKTEFVVALSDKTGITKKDSGVVVNAVIDLIKETLLAGETIRLPGFTFEVVERGERKGKNPQTGEEIIIPARKVPRVRVGKKFKNEIKDA